MASRIVSKDYMFVWSIWPQIVCKRCTLEKRETSDFPLKLVEKCHNCFKESKVVFFSHDTLISQGTVLCWASAHRATVMTENQKNYLFVFVALNSTCFLLVPLSFFCWSTVQSCCVYWKCTQNHWASRGELVTQKLCIWCLGLRSVNLGRAETVCVEITGLDVKAVPYLWCHLCHPARRIHDATCHWKALDEHISLTCPLRNIY